MVAAGLKNQKFEHTYNSLSAKIERRAVSTRWLVK